MMAKEHPGKRILRVFPCRTSMTPSDGLAFVGDPPLWRPQADVVHVSVAFTWDIKEGERLEAAWSQYYPVVKLGGPAIDTEPPVAFVPGRYLRHGVTITSRGCPNRCPWCLVPEREGGIQELEITPGWIVQDNNLLATSRKHQKQVFEMLRCQRRAVSFPGGLESRLLDDWVVEQLRRLPIDQVFFAADSQSALENLWPIRERLSFLSRQQLRCYVLIGFGGESPAEAIMRLRRIWDMGFMPFAQLYQPPDNDKIRYNARWRDIARCWSRPAIMKAQSKAWQTETVHR